MEPYPPPSAGDTAEENGNCRTKEKTLFLVLHGGGTENRVIGENLT